MNSNNYVLVLNKYWVAINVINIYDAIVSMCRDRSKALCTKTYQLYDINQWLNNFSLKHTDQSDHMFINTPSIKIKKPEIIVLTEYDKIPKIRINVNKKNILKRDGNICQYCSSKLTKSELTIDHIIPKSKGGKYTWDNCVVSCKKCNMVKADKSLDEVNMRLLKNPKPPNWPTIINKLPRNYSCNWDKFIKNKL